MTHTAPSGAGRPARLGVDVSAALNLVGSLVKYLGSASLLPVAFALSNSEPVWPFLAAGALITGIGLILERLTAGAEEVGIREGYLVISLVWLIAGAYGALPYILSGDPQLGRPVDAMFEGMSGFTTTGASTATNVEALPESIQVWRQLTIWLGGIGVVALGLAVLPRLRVGGRQLLESELAASRTQALSGRIRDTVGRFWRLYLVLTGAGFLALALPGWIGAPDTMDTFEAFAHALSTVGTGSFSTEPASIGAFGALTQWTIVAFMAVAAMNYVVLFRVFFQRRPRRAAQDEEFRAYLAILLVAGAVLAAILLSRGPVHGGSAIRAAFFEATSAVTTTGYFTVDYDQWPTVALMLIALLFFVGGCAGSTTGSIKIVRHLVLARIIGREVVRTAHPELVHPVRMNGAVVAEETQLAVISFVLIYLAVFVLGAGLLALDSAFGGPRFGALDLVYASASTLGNAGVGLGPAGATGSFASFGDGSTVAMTLLMWAGRLEILPLVVLLRRSYWRA